MKNIIKLFTVAFVFLVSTYNNRLQPSIDNEQASKQENMIFEQSTDDYDNEEPPTPLGEDDFIVENADTIIELGGSYKNLKTTEKMNNFKDVDEWRVYYTISYESFVVFVTPDDKELIWCFNLTTPSLKTSRGIAVGDNISDVIDKYGIADWTASGRYTYLFKSDAAMHYSKTLSFYVDENCIVIYIQYEL